MFNWLGNLFPYSDLHSLNLDWILSKMKETAAQAAKAIADSANALSQVIEAKTAAQNAQTAAQDAQTAANKAAGNAASAAANAVQALNAAQTAQETATAANNKAQTAQETATAANNKAQTAQTAAETAQTAAENANTTANTAINKFPVGTYDISDNAVTKDKIANNAVTKDKIADASITTSKLGSNSVTRSKLGYDVYLPLSSGEFSSAATKTPSQIAAGEAKISFTRDNSKATIFVCSRDGEYQSGDVTHYLNTYSDPFVLFRTDSIRNVKITLSDYNPVTGDVTLYSGNLKITVSKTTGKADCLFTFDEPLPFGDDVNIPYGIASLTAYPPF